MFYEIPVDVMDICYMAMFLRCCLLSFKNIFQKCLYLSLSCFEKQKYINCKTFTNTPQKCYSLLSSKCYEDVLIKMKIFY